MKTKEEIVAKLCDYLDLAIMNGFFTKVEIEEIYALEREYDIQTEKERKN